MIIIKRDFASSKLLIDVACTVTLRAGSLESPGHQSNAVGPSLMKIVPK